MSDGSQIVLRAAVKPTLLLQEVRIQLTKPVKT